MQKSPAFWMTTLGLPSFVWIKGVLSRSKFVRPAPSVTHVLSVCLCCLCSVVCLRRLRACRVLVPCLCCRACVLVVCLCRLRAWGAWHGTHTFGWWVGIGVGVMWRHGGGGLLTRVRVLHAHACTRTHARVRTRAHTDRRCVLCAAAVCLWCCRLACVLLVCAAAMRVRALVLACLWHASIGHSGGFIRAVVETAAFVAINSRKKSPALRHPVRACMR